MESKDAVDYVNVIWENIPISCCAHSIADQNAKLLRCTSMTIG